MSALVEVDGSAEIDCGFGREELVPSDFDGPEVDIEEEGAPAEAAFVTQAEELAGEGPPDGDAVAIDRDLAAREHAPGESRSSFKSRCMRS